VQRAWPACTPAGEFLRPLLCLVVPLASSADLSEVAVDQRQEESGSTLALVPGPCPPRAGLLGVDAADAGHRLVVGHSGRSYAVSGLARDLDSTEEVRSSPFCSADAARRSSPPCVQTGVVGRYGRASWAPRLSVPGSVPLLLLLLLL
jgi:hypothetical protein